MAEQRSSIDDLLVMGATPNPQRQPITPEYQPSEEAVQEALDDIAPRETSDEYGLDVPDEPVEAAYEEPVQEAPDVEDEYGNKQAAKTYTEEQVNERINQAVRDRLARLERNQQSHNQPMPSNQQIQQAEQSGFQYNPDSSEDWSTQLKKFTWQAMDEREAMRTQQAVQQREQYAQIEFETKFHSGKAKFSDFNEVVGGQPITDAMVMASRSLSDPAAFFYAASKRAPKELEEISRIPDQYGQMMALGRLEQKMKQSRPVSRAPAPASKVKGDMPIGHKEKREPTIEELIQRDAAKKLALRKQRQR